MFKYGKIVLALVAMSVAMGAAASTASAVTISPGGAITATSNGRLVLTAIFGTVRCNVALPGSLNRSVAVGASAGTITGLTTTCDGGIVITRLGQPWNIRLISTTPAAPPYTSALFLIENVQFAVSAPLGCLFTGNVGFTVAQGVSPTPNSINLLANSLAGNANCGGGTGTLTNPATPDFFLAPTQIMT